MDKQAWKRIKLRTKQLRKFLNSDFSTEIGEFGREQLSVLLEWLFGGSWEKTNVGIAAPRLAPSIISRSEVEIFSLSMPRFAIRFYVSNGGHFLNLRRIASFADRAIEWPVEDIEKATKRRGNCGQYDGHSVNKQNRKDLKKSPSRYLIRNTCIADSLLPRKSSITDDWHLIEVELGLPYGEGKTISGTPFVRHVDVVGGGMCAQACCFMANALLHDHCSAIYGISEISAMAKTEGDLEAEFRMQLNGLKPFEMQRYFRRVGLNGHLELPFKPKGIPDSSYHHLLRAYLLSGFPIILSCDLGRLIGSGKAVQNAEGFHEDLEKSSVYPVNIGLDSCKKLFPGEFHPRVKRKRRNHMVIMTGVKEADSNEPHYMIHDPAYLPFLDVTLTQLKHATTYKETDENESYSSINTLLVFPVLPARVNVPLGMAGAFPEHFYTAVETSATMKKKGLLQLVGSEFSIHDPDGTQTAIRRQIPADDLRYYGDDLGEFRLIQQNNLSDHQWFEQASDPVREFLAAMDVSRFSGAHWCWVQKWRHYFIFYDAELDIDWELETGEILNHLVLGIIKQVNLVHTLCFVRKHSDSEAEPGEHGDTGPEEAGSTDWRIPLNKISIITSCDVDAETNLEDSIETLEAYCFMQAFLRRSIPEPQDRRSRERLKLARKTYRSTRRRNFSRRWRLGISHGGSSGRRPCLPCKHPELCVMDQLSAAQNSITLRDDLKEILKSRFDRNLCALASYLPEIASPVPDRKKAAIRALKCLIDVAQDLEVPVLECVGGSRVATVIPCGEMKGRRRVDEIFGATVRDNVSALRDLAKTFKDLGEYAFPKGITLAVELEPGPLYNLGNLNSVDRFSSYLRELKVPSVGLNLDIAHYHLAGIAPHVIRGKLQDGSWLNIEHIHISEHGKGHFGDCWPGTFDHHQSIHFDWDGWLNLFDFLVNERDYTGYFSLEQEAAVDIQASIEHFKEKCCPESR